MSTRQSDRILQRKKHNKVKSFSTGRALSTKDKHNETAHGTAPTTSSGRRYARAHKKLPITLLSSSDDDDEEEESDVITNARKVVQKAKKTTKRKNIDQEKQPSTPSSLLSSDTAYPLDIRIGLCIKASSNQKVPRWPQDEKLYFSVSSLNTKDDFSFVVESLLDSIKFQMPNFKVSSQEGSGSLSIYTHKQGTVPREELPGTIQHAKQSFDLVSGDMSYSHALNKKTLLKVVVNPCDKGDEVDSSGDEERSSAGETIRSPVHRPLFLLDVLIMGDMQKTIDNDASEDSVAPDATHAGEQQTNPVDRLMVLLYPLVEKHKSPDTTDAFYKPETKDGPLSQFVLDYNEFKGMRFGEFRYKIAKFAYDNKIKSYTTVCDDEVSGDDDEEQETVKVLFGAKTALFIRPIGNKNVFKKVESTEDLQTMFKTVFGVRSATKTEIDGKKVLRFVVSLGKMKKNDVSYSCDHDPFSVVAHSQETIDSPVVFKKKRKTGRQHRQALRSPVTEVEEVIQTLYHNVDSPFHFGLTSQHAAILRQRLRESTRLKLLVKNLLEANEWPEMDTLFGEQVKLLTEEPAKGVFPPVDGKIPYRGTKKNMNEGYATAQTQNYQAKLVNLLENALQPTNGEEHSLSNTPVAMMPGAAASVATLNSGGGGEQQFSAHKFFRFFRHDPATNHGGNDYGVFPTGLGIAGSVDVIVGELPLDFDGKSLLRKAIERSRRDGSFVFGKISTEDYQAIARKEKSFAFQLGNGPWVSGEDFKHYSSHLLRSFLNESGGDHIQIEVSIRVTAMEDDDIDLDAIL